MQIAIRVLGLAIIASIGIGVAYGMPDTTDLAAWWRQGAQVDPDLIYRHFRWPGCHETDCSHMYYNDDFLSAWIGSALSVAGRPGSALWNSLASNQIGRWVIPILAAGFAVAIAKSIWTFLIEGEKKSNEDGN